MPYMTNGERDYKKEYRLYHKKKRAKKKRALNNKANRAMGTYGNRDGKDIAHKDNNVSNNKRSNLVKQKPSTNRSVPINSKGRRRRKGK